jgi:hypothetical protein
LTAELRAILEENYSAAGFSDQPGVVFLVDPKTRTCDVRDDLMRFAFGEPASAKAAALDLAQRLGLATDRRSSIALFVPAAYEVPGRRQVVLWVFPSEDALQLQPTEEGASISVLKDVFSQKSRLRKAAHFMGRNSRTDFLQGKVLDYQAGDTTREVATFWIERFLGCSLEIKDDAGSRMLAKALRQVHKQLEERADREQLHAAALAIRHAPRGRTSFASFANQYLSDGPVKELFLAACPSRDVRSVSFDFNRVAFDKVWAYRVFELKAGIYVSAPSSTIGRGVRLEGEGGERLVCKGVVVDERMRARHG